MLDVIYNRKARAKDDNRKLIDPFCSFALEMNVEDYPDIDKIELKSIAIAHDGNDVVAFDDMGESHILTNPAIIGTREHIVGLLIPVNASVEALDYAADVFDYMYNKRIEKNTDKVKFLEF